MHVLAQLFIPDTNGALSTGSFDQLSAYSDSSFMMMLMATLHRHFQVLSLQLRAAMHDLML